MGTPSNESSVATMAAAKQVMGKRDIRYFWLRDETNRPLACIASDKDEETLHFSLAIHNLKDKFNKQLGKSVALARLQGNGHARFTSSFPVSQNIKKELLTRIATGNGFGKDVIPESVRNAAQFRLDNYKDKNAVTVM
jgi:hypothetical protein